MSMIKTAIGTAVRQARKRYLYRKALTKPNLPYFLWRYVGNATRTLRARSNAVSYPVALPIARELTERGIAIGPYRDFLSDTGCKALAEASNLVLEISRSPHVQATVAKATSAVNKNYLVNLIEWDHEHSPDSPFLKLALDRKLLDVASLYLGMWPQLHAIGAWLNVPTDDEAKESQLWHRDPEDMMVLKAFIYLVDVDNDRGPFCYVPNSHPFSQGAGKVPTHKHKKRITDEEMEAVFSSDCWLTCTGPAGTMILADTVGYHRGGRPTNGSRILITLTYTSGIPFSARRLRIAARPAWAVHSMQNHAL